MADNGYHSQKWIPCPINGCRQKRNPMLLCCKDCWKLIPVALRRTYLQERNSNSHSDSTSLAAIACLEAAESEMTQRGEQ